MEGKITLEPQDLALCKAAFSDAMKANNQETELKIALVNLEIKLLKMYEQQQSEAKEEVEATEEMRVEKD